MPGKVKVRIVAGRNLPVMDRASDTCDAFVEIKLGNTTYKTEVFRRSLNPQWNSEWFRFEVDDEELQDEPLQIRVMDYDTYSANDAIGKVYIDLNPLLCKEAGSLISGWFPIYDTMHGIRGEISVMVKVHLFSDSNKYRESSCGVQFFYSCSIPHGYKAQAILGFVEELVVNDDPEYQWIDKIRTPRASNEARQTLFSKLSGEVQRKIGLKALELGGNSVIGYHQCFDLEGESGIVVRGIGTAVILTRLTETSMQASSPPKDGGRELSPPSVALRRVASSASVTSIHACGAQASRWLPIPNFSQARSRSPSPNPFGSSPRLRRKECGSAASPKRISKARSEVFTPLCEMECISCKDAILQAEKATQSGHITHQLKRVAAQSGHRSPHVTTSRLKRIRSDPLYPRSPLLEDSSTNSNLGPSSPTGVVPKALQSPAKVGVPCGPRRSSDSDLSTTPKGNSLGDSGGSGSGGTRTAVQRPTIAQESLSMLEYPFITMKQFPLGLIQHIGGVVSARSVKLLVQINNPDEPETRDAWWTELRKEIRSHIRALGCNVVLGYMETTNISDDICILSASGTAAVLNTAEQENSGMSGTPMLGMGLLPRPSLVTTSVTTDRRDCEREKEKDTVRDKEKPLKIDINLANQMRQTHLSDWGDDLASSVACGICHIPYSESSVPFPAYLVRCNVCRRSKVPDVLFMTIEPPPNIPVTGKGCLLQARVCKGKKDGRGEQNAKEISDSLPFLEYELHRQLLNKLKVKGMNAIFGLKVQVSIGDKLLIGVATGTGAFISALPSPSLPKITCGKGTNSSKMAEIQKLIQDAVFKNKEYYSLKPLVFEPVPESQLNGKAEDVDSSEDDDLPDIDLSSGNKDACILEVDDAEDVDIIAQLIDPKTPDGFEMCNTEILPGVDNFICNLQMFTRVYRTKLSSGHSSRHVSQTFEEVIQSLFVKLRRLVPCCLASLSFQADLVEQDEMQISILGVAVGLGDPSLLTTVGHQHTKQRQKQNGESDMIFPMDEDKVNDLGHNAGHAKHSRQQATGGRYCYHLSLKEHFGVEITPLSYIPGRKIERYLGDLDFFFIRESTSIRESGGLNGFIQSFMTEMLAIVRAHVASLGGNAVVSFHMTQCILLYNPHKNQGQCLINVAGDAIFVQLPTTQHMETEMGRFTQSETENQSVAT